MRQLQVHLPNATGLKSKCGVSGNARITTNKRLVTCARCNLEIQRDRSGRLHFISGGKVPCGRSGVTTTTRYVDVTCGVCLTFRPPNRKSKRKHEEGFADRNFKGLGILRCRICGRPYNIHVGYQQCIPQEAVYA